VHPQDVLWNTLNEHKVFTPVPAGADVFWQLDFAQGRGRRAPIFPPAHGDAKAGLAPRLDHGATLWEFTHDVRERQTEKERAREARIGRTDVSARRG
jgi:hypothetical protein